MLSFPRLYSMQPKSSRKSRHATADVGVVTTAISPASSCQLLWYTVTSSILLTLSVCTGGHAVLVSEQRAQSRGQDGSLLSTFYLISGPCSPMDICLDHFLNSPAVLEHQRNLPEGITLLRKGISRDQYLVTATFNRSR